MMMTLCARCGEVDERGDRPGACRHCAPTPEQAAENDAAVQAARNVTPKREYGRRDGRARPRLTDVFWLRGERANTIAHLFRPGEPMSCCNKVERRAEHGVPKPGQRGCRRCAYAAGLIPALNVSIST